LYPFIKKYPKDSSITSRKEKEKESNASNCSFFYSTLHRSCRLTTALDLWRIRCRIVLAWYRNHRRKISLKCSKMTTRFFVMKLRWWASFQRVTFQQLKINNFSPELFRDLTQTRVTVIYETVCTNCCRMSFLVRYQSWKKYFILAHTPFSVNCGTARYTSFGTDPVVPC